MPSTTEPDQGVVRVHRVGAVVVAAVIGLIGVLGFVGGLGFFDTSGAPVLGLSTNGALSTVSLLTAAVLIAAAIRGGRLASTVMIVTGTLFLISAFGNLAVMGTSLNLFAFRLPNVFFSIGAGLVLLVLGAYGRISSKLPQDNPYRRERHPDEDEGVEDFDGQPSPSTRAEAAADVAMAAAARAAAAGAATSEQRRGLEAMNQVRTHEERRRVWMDLSDGDRGNGSGGGRSPGHSAVA
jgi:hypothetical protein